MKRTGLLHVELSALVAGLGHTDQVVLADRGLPLPPTVPMVDLALTPGVVDLRTVLDALLAEIVVEAHTIAVEAAERAPATWLDDRAAALGSRTAVPHEEFKALLGGAAFAVRTGEQTPYANVILRCGVPF